MEQWYCAVRGQKPQGPFRLEDLQARLASGQLHAQDVVWKAGMPRWLPAMEVQELSEAPTMFVPRGPVRPPSHTPPPPAAGMPVPTEEERPGRAPSREPGSGFLARLHSLPKPILFGLYGALGGLLGVLLLGELLWLLLSPATQQIDPLKVAISPTVTVFPGGSNKFTVKVARHELNSPVRIEVSDVPDKVTVNTITIPKDADTGEVEVIAADARLDSYQLKVLATAVDRPDVVVNDTIRLKVSPTILVSLSPSVIVYVGDRNRFPVKIVRRSYEGPVVLEASDPPGNVSVTPATLAADQSEAELEVHVGARASAGTHRLNIVARAPDRDEPRTVQGLDLSIKTIPPSLQVSVPSSVTLYKGGKNTFGVKIARNRLEGPVRLELLGLPVGVSASPVTIPADKLEAEVEVAAEAKALAGMHAARVTAQSTTDRSIETPEPLRLKVEVPPPAVALAASPKVSVYAGDKAKVKLKIARFENEQPVTVQLVDAPFFLSASVVHFPRGETEAEMEVLVTDAALREALPRTQTVRLIAKGLGVPRESAQSVALEIVPPPVSLRVSASPEVELYQAGKCRFTVKIARSGFLGPVRLEVKDQPAGLVIPPVDVPEGTLEAEVEGEAQKTLPVGKKPMALHALGTALPGKDSPMGIGQFTLDVKPYDSNKKAPPLDIVFALDVTGSMQPEIDGMRDGIESFLRELQRNKLEARVGLIAFRDMIEDPPDEAFQILKFGTTGLFTADHAAFRREVAKLKADGGGDDPESSYDALLRASNYPFRPHAMRIFVLITDVGPQGRGKSATQGQVLDAFARKKIDQLHLIVPRNVKDIYTRLQEKSKGAWFDFFDAAKAGGFAKLLPVVSKEIARISIAAGPAAPLAIAPPPLPEAKDVPRLPEAVAPAAPPAAAASAPPEAERPAAPPAEAVTNPREAAPPPVAAVVSPPSTEIPAIKAVQSTSLYDEKDRFQLVLAIALWTAVMAAGIGLLLVLGQKLYLQKTWPGLADVGKAMGAGLAAGLLGGAIGQVFYQSTAGGVGWDIVTRVAAWGLLGSLLGAGMAIFVPNLRWHRALLGGLLGGLVGALGFTLFSLFAGSLLGRWIGATLVGFCIGLMIALAELAFRRYWLEVTFGAREVRTVTLGPATVALGGDERLSSVYVPGAAPRALGYRLENDRILCEDFATGKTFEVRPGDQKTIGGVRIAVRGVAKECVAQEPSSGLSLRFAKGRTLELMEGMPITADDIPGLDAQGQDGIVAIISRRPANPQVLLLRNRSRQTWRVALAKGQTREITPGLGIELSLAFEIDFGKARARFSPE